MRNRLHKTKPGKVAAVLAAAALCLGTLLTGDIQKSTIADAAPDEIAVQADEAVQDVWVTKAPKATGYNVRVTRGDVVTADELAEQVLGAGHGLTNLQMRKEIRYGTISDIDPSEYRSYRFGSVGDRVIVVYGADADGRTRHFEAKVAVDVPGTELQEVAQHDRVQTYTDENGVIYTMTDRLTGGRGTSIMYPDGSHADIWMLACGGYNTRYVGANDAVTLFQKAPYTNTILRYESTRTGRSKYFHDSIDTIELVDDVSLPAEEETIVNPTLEQKPDPTAEPETEPVATEPEWQPAEPETEAPMEPVTEPWIEPEPEHVTEPETHEWGEQEREITPAWDETVMVQDASV